MMKSPVFPSVRELKNTPLRLGEERVFAHAQEADGDEPDFYSVHTMGDRLLAKPRWINSTPLEARPRPPIAGKEGIALTAVDDFHFEISDALAPIADLYYCTVGLWLITDRLLEVIQRLQPGGVEHRRISVRAGSGEDIPGFNIVMPLVVIDAVDTSKTDVTVKRVIGGPSGEMNVVEFNSGYLVKGSVPDGVLMFREESAGNWLWRRAVLEAAAAAGATGILGKCTMPGLRDEISI